MTHMDLGVQGAKRQSWQENPREILRRLLEKNPSWGRGQLLDEFKRLVENSPSHLEAIIEYWFSNNYYSLLERPDRSDERRQRQASQTSQFRKALNEKIDDRVKVVLLDMQMPNGKPLRNCTGTECKALSGRMGAWLLRISKQMKPTDIVGDVLTETQIKKLYK